MMSVLAAALITPLAMLGWLQNHLLYFPTSRLMGNPESIGLAYESVYLRTADGLKIHGWFVPADSSQVERAGSGGGSQGGGETGNGVTQTRDGDSRNGATQDSDSQDSTSAATTATVLFFHGNAGNISDRLDTISIFHRLGLNTFLIDYRGFGNSEGSPDEAGTYADAEAAWRYLVVDRSIAEDSLVFFGRSLGGGVAAFLATKHCPRAMVLESTFTSCPDLAGDLYPIVPRSLISVSYDNLARVAQLGRGCEKTGHSAKTKSGVPLLIVHSRDDELIPIAHGRRLFEAAPEPKHFLEISGTHGDGFYTSGEQYTEGLRNFFERYL